MRIYKHSVQVYKRLTIQFNFSIIKFERCERKSFSLFIIKK